MGTVPPVNVRKAAYWASTVFAALALGTAGAADLMRAPAIMESLAHLGYPAYFATILGTWELLGAAAILAPDLPSERKLRAAARLAHIGYWEHDLAANRVSWSEESRAVLGVPLTERTRSWNEFIDLVHPDDRSVLDECRTRVARGEPTHRMAFRLQPGDGIRYVETWGKRSGTRTVRRA